jgi:hypothetical protein
MGRHVPGPFQDQEWIKAKRERQSVELGRDIWSGNSKTTSQAGIDSQIGRDEGLFEELKIARRTI